MVFKISILKALLAVINTTLSILGVGLIALSLYELNTSTPGTVDRITIVIQIFIGSFVILTSFLGCFDSCRESLGLTWSYAICILILIIFQIYIIIVAHTTDYVQNAAENFNSLWSNRTHNAAEIAEIEQKYQCCGKNGSEDYVLMGGGIPVYCYKNYDRMREHLYTQSCLQRLQDNAMGRGNTGLLIKWILFIMELMALGCAALLGVSIRHKQRREQFGN